MASTIGVKLGLEGEKEFRKGLKDVQSQAKTLDKQLQALESSFDDGADAMEQNEKATELLQRKADKLTESIEMMKDMVDKAAEKYGESSSECQSWQQALADAETKLNDTNSAIAEHEAAAEEANSALGLLTAEITSQKTELDDLRDAYINAVLEFGESSDEASALAGEITALNISLQENQSELDAATASADSLTTSMDDASDATSSIGTAATDALGAFSPAMAGIITAATSADLVDSITGLGGLFVDIVEDIINVRTEFENTRAILATGTGATGDDLDDLEGKARQLWWSIDDTDFTMDNASAILAALATTLGNDYTETTTLTSALAKFSVVTGVDGAVAVNGIADALKAFGLITGDATTDQESMIGTMDMLMVAAENADIPMGTLISSISGNAAAADGLGMSMEELIAWMVSYRQTGGDTNDMLSSLTRAQRNLNEAGYDVPTVWEAVVNALNSQEAATKKGATEVEGYGITLNDVFGKTSAQTISHFCSNGKLDIDTYSDALTSSSGELERMYNQTRTTADESSKAGKTIKLMAADISDSSTTTGTIFKEAMDNNGFSLTAFKTLFGLFTDVFKIKSEQVGNNSETMEDDFDTATTDMSDEAATAFEDIESSASSNMSQTADDVSGAMVDITNAVNANHAEWVNTLGGTIKGPTIKVPEVYYTTGADGSKTPHAIYHYYAKAYDQAMLLNGATVFGMAGGAALVGGEKAGSEVVVGEQHLLNMFEDTLRNVGYAGDGEIGKIERLLQEYLPGIGNQKIVLDSGALVGATANQMNTALGQISMRGGRW